MSRQKPIASDVERKRARRRKRYVRRQSWFEKAQEAPQNFVLDWWENFEALDWDKIQRRLSWPAAMTLNLLLCLVRISVILEAGPPPAPGTSILRDPGRQRPNGYGSASAFIQREYELDRPAAGLFSTLFSLSFWRSLLLGLLILTSIINTLYLFTRSRTYQLLHADPNDPLNSTHIQVGSFEYHSPAWSQTWYGSLVWPAWRRIFGNSAGQSREVLELEMWTPPLLALNVFRWFSPAQVLVVHLATGHNWYYLIPGAFAIGAQLHYTTHRYVELLKDKQVLFGQMFSEYNLTYVNPRLLVIKHDKATNFPEWRPSQYTESSDDHSSGSGSEENVPDVYAVDSGRRDPHGRRHSNITPPRQPTPFATPRAAFRRHPRYTEPY